MIKRNFVKEMLAKTDTQNSWHPETIMDAAMLSNVYTHGSHIVMTTMDKAGNIITKDVTKEILSREGLIK